MYLKRTIVDTKSKKIYKFRATILFVDNKFTIYRKKNGNIIWCSINEADSSGVYSVSTFIDKKSFLEFLETKVNYYRFYEIVKKSFKMATYKAVII